MTDVSDSPRNPELEPHPSTGTADEAASQAVDEVPTEAVEEFATQDVVTANGDEEMGGELEHRQEQDSEQGNEHRAEQDAGQGRPARSAQLGSLSADVKMSERRKRATTVGLVALVVAIIVSAIASISYAVTHAGKGAEETQALSDTPTTTTTRSASNSMGILTCDPLGIWNSVTARTTATSCLVARAAAREIKQNREGEYSFKDPMTGEPVSVTCTRLEGATKGLSCTGVGGISVSLKDPTRTLTEEDNLPLFTTVVNVFTRPSETPTTLPRSSSSTIAEPSSSGATRTEGASSRISATTTETEAVTSVTPEMSPVNSTIPMASFIPTQPEPSTSSWPSEDSYNDPYGDSYNDSAAGY